MVRFFTIAHIFFFLFLTSHALGISANVISGRVVISRPLDSDNDDIADDNNFENRIAQKLQRMGKRNSSISKRHSSRRVNSNSKRAKKRPRHQMWRLEVPDISGTTEAERVAATVAMINELKASGEFADAIIESDGTAFATTFNDPYLPPSAGTWGQPYMDLWGHAKIKAVEAWALTLGQGVLVAVVDTGVDYSHQDLGLYTVPNGPGKVLIGKNIITGALDGLDDNGHGTHVAGTIAAIANNGVGIAGLAPNATILAVKVLNSVGSGSWTDIASGITYAVDSGAKVINLSLGAIGVTPSYVASAVQYAHDHGVVVVVASGNDNADVYAQLLPVAPFTIAVAASAFDDTRCPFSNYGVRVAVSAPGGESTAEHKPFWYSSSNILSLRSFFNAFADVYTNVGGNYRRLRGTSMAAPHVAGAAAMILSYHPSYTPEQVRQALIKGADDAITPGFDSEVGYGRINILNSLNVPAPIGLAILQYPATLSGIVPINGYVEGSAATSWQLEYGSGEAPSSWTQIAQGTGAVASTLLANWDLTSVSSGRKTLRLSASNSGGTVYENRVDVNVNSAGSITVPPPGPLPAFPPTQPTGPPNTSATSTTTLWLSWGDNANNETGFEVESATSAVGPFTLRATVAANLNVYTITGLTPGTTYYVRVRAVNSYGASAYTEVSLPTTLPNTIPVAPTLLTPTIGNNSVVLSWTDNSNNESAFYLERLLPSAAWLSLGSTAGNVVTYTDATAPTNKFITYRLRGYNSAGYSSYSNTMTITTPLVYPALWPTSFAAAVVSANAITISWADNNSQEDSYGLEFGSSSTGPWTLISKPANSTSHSHLLLTPATTYYYRIRALSAAIGNSGYSTIVSATTLDVVPIAPSALSASTVSSTQIDLSWNDNSANEMGFVVERSTSVLGPFSAIVSPAAGVTQYSNSGLQKFTPYYYRVKAVNGIGSSSYSATATATTLDTIPTAPSNLVALALSASQLQINWLDNSDNETGFKLERSDAPTGPFTVINSPAAGVIQFIDSGLQKARAYYYRIRSENAVGSSSYSAVATGTTLDLAPIAPSGLAASTISSTQIDLSWADNSDNETGFVVERAASVSGPFSAIVTAAAGVTQYSSTGLQKFTPYYYRVKAVNSIGGSSYSSTVTATTLDAIPITPTGLSAIAQSATQIKIVWVDNSDNETNFVLERFDSLSGSFSVVNSPAAGVIEFIDTSARKATRYFFRVKAVNAVGSSSYSVYTSVTTPDLAPDAPSGLTATTISATQIDLGWVDNSDNEIEFVLERSTGDSNSFSPIASIAAGETVYSDNSVVKFTTYYYRVKAVNNIGSSSYSGIVNTTTLDAIPLEPSNLVVSALSPTEIQVDWGDNSDNETNFVVERSDSSTGPFSVVNSPATDVIRLIDTSAQKARTYYFRVKAVNAIGSSVYSEVANATTPDAIPLAPTNLAAQVLNSTQIRLTWTDNSDNETSFHLQMALGLLGSWNNVTTQPGTNAVIITVGSLAVNTTYYFRISAIGSVGESPYANTVNATTDDLPPTAPAGLALAVQSATQIRVSWTDTSHNETGFKIERSADGLSGWALVGSLGVGAVELLQTGLAPNTRYFYRVYSLNNFGASAFTSTISAVTLPLPPATPQSFIANVVSADQVKLDWAFSGTDQTGFKLERAIGNGGWLLVSDVSATLRQAFVTVSALRTADEHFRIVSYNTGGASAASTEFAITPPQLPPQAPQDFRVTTLAASAVFAWNPQNLDDAVGCLLEWSEPNGIWYPATSLDCGAGQFTLPVDATVSYQYRLRAFNDGGSSASAPRSSR